MAIRRSIDERLAQARHDAAAVERVVQARIQGGTAPHAADADGRLADARALVGRIEAEAEAAVAEDAASGAVERRAGMVERLATKRAAEQAARAVLTDHILGTYRQAVDGYNAAFGDVFAELQGNPDLETVDLVALRAGGPRIQVAGHAPYLPLGVAWTLVDLARRIEQGELSPAQP